ncbi:hypothetical protein EC919_101319 [Pseudomonas graminis]|uniref:hypothetical protein n=1 Tax=Pseudomonas graminis TaxID=158627 RepID=UPI00105FD0C0|nr:hypothetical protein [Pseudomonas graminis]TDV58273.1 hypothetical protein EC919_101319 [Pseudomonas graminis]
MPTFSEDTAGAQARPASPGEALHTLQEDAKDLLDTARDHGTEQFGNYRDGAAEQIENLAKTASAAAEELQDKDALGISHYISDIAESLSAFATSIRGKSAEEMLQQAGRLARENPALFVTGSVAVGFGLSRFLRASSPDLTASTSSTSSAATDSPQYPSGDRDTGVKAGESEGDGLSARPAHEGEAAHGAPIQRPDPLAPRDPAAHGSATADLEEGGGIQQSGLELGSFNADPGTASSPAPTHSPTPDKPAPRGEF